jgi:hypothetical protein
MLLWIFMLLASASVQMYLSFMGVSSVVAYEPHFLGRLFLIVGPVDAGENGCAASVYKDANN